MRDSSGAGILPDSETRRSAWRSRRPSHPGGGFLVADWHEGLSDNWEPLRDLWQRYS